MDRVTMERDLAMTDRHVAEGMVHIARQKQRIEELETYGRDVGVAKRLLESFEQLMRQHEEHRDRLIAKLGS